VYIPKWIAWERKGRDDITPRYTSINTSIQGNVCATAEQSPHLRTPNPGFNPEFTLLYNKCGGELRVKPGDWRPEMWAQVKKRGDQPPLHMYSIYFTVYSMFCTCSFSSGCGPGSDPTIKKVEIYKMI
jgi:hypothetical protein